MSPPQQSVFEEYNDESGSMGKLVQKSKHSPFVPLGMAGFLGVLGYGAYKYRNRGSISTSVFLMQLRVAAQGTMVGALTVGLVYTMANEYIFNKPNSTESENINTKNP